MPWTAERKAELIFQLIQLFWVLEWHEVRTPPFPFPPNQKKKVKEKNRKEEKGEGKIHNNVVTLAGNIIM